LEHRLIAELDERNLPSKHSIPSTSAFLASLLNLSPREAGQRVRHARYLGPRITVAGERLQPLLPVTAEARTTGSITAQHASVIIGTIDKLPATLPVDEIAKAEEFLVELAQQFDARVLAGIARQLLDTLDPDGTALRPPPRPDRGRGRLDHHHAPGQAVVDPTELDRRRPEASAERSRSASLSRAGLRARPVAAPPCRQTGRRARHPSWVG
jgi:hypothetical protein